MDKETAFSLIMHKYDLFLFVGEPSGDFHGEILLKALKKKNPNLKIAGVGGPRMRKHLSHCVMPMERFLVMGFLDILRFLPKLFLQFFQLKRQIKRLNPKVAIFIDYPGFNLRLENALRKSKFKGKLIHLVCPSVWAWGKWRIPYMAKNLDLLLAFFPFEKKCFNKTNLSIEHIGHPLVAKIASHEYRPFLENEKRKVLAIFPGSRPKEIARNLQLQLEVAHAFTQAHSDFVLAISIADKKLRDTIESEIEKQQLKIGTDIFLFNADDNYELMRKSYAAIATSGTINLELGLHNVPSIITYGMPWLDVFLARRIFHIILPYYCIVNILAKKEIFPELYGPHFTKEALSEKLHALIEPSNHQKTSNDCEDIKKILTAKDASDEAAMHILESLN